MHSIYKVITSSTASKIFAHLGKKVNMKNVLKYVANITEYLLHVLVMHIYVAANSQPHNKYTR